MELFDCLFPESVFDGFKKLRFLSWLQNRDTPFLRSHEWPWMVMFSVKASSAIRRYLRILRSSIGMETNVILFMNCSTFQYLQYFPVLFWNNAKSVVEKIISTNTSKIYLFFGFRENWISISLFCGSNFRRWNRYANSGSASSRYYYRSTTT